MKIPYHLNLREQTDRIEGCQRYNRTVSIQNNCQRCKGLYMITDTYIICKWREYFASDSIPDNNFNTDIDF